MEWRNDVTMRGRERGKEGLREGEKGKRKKD